MKAWIQTGYGSPGNVAFEEVPQPVPGAGDLLVRVHAAGLNAADRLLLRGAEGEELLADRRRSPAATVADLCALFTDLARIKRERD